MLTTWKNGKYQPLVKYVTLKDLKKLSNAIDIINGDSDTKGSIKKAIKDLVGEAPEAYDTLKEIADKLKSDDDLHKALNDAIILKASSDALNTEINRATSAETANKNAIDGEVTRAKGAEKSLQDQITSNDSDITNLTAKHESLSRKVQDIAATGGASTATNVTYNNDSSGLNAENTQDAIDELSSIGHFAKRGGVVNISTNYNANHIAEVLTLSQAIAKVPSSDRILGFQGKFLSEDGWNTYIFNSDSISDWNNVSKWYKYVNNVELNKNFLSSYPFCKTEVNYHIKELYIDKDKLPEFANYGFLFFGFQKEKNVYVIHFVGTNDNFASYTTLSYMRFNEESLLSNMPLKIIKYNTEEVLGYIILNDFTTKTPLYRNVELTDYIFKLDCNPILFSTIHESLLNGRVTKLEEKVIGDSIDLIFGGYIPTDTGTIDLGNIISTKNYAYKIIDCKEGDKFLINGVGGYSPRLFCFIDTNNNTVLTSFSNFSAKNYLVSAPANSVKCIFNFALKSEESTPSLYKYNNVYNGFKENYDFTNNIEKYNYTESLDLNNRIQELYIQDTDYKYYRFVYFFYQKLESRFVIEIKGSNSPDFTDEKVVVYYTSSNIENGSLITLKKEGSSKGEIAGYIIVRNFTEEDTINLAELKPVLVKKSFDLAQNTYIALAANKVISTLNHPIKTIGALYFDGWTGNSEYSLANENLFPNSTLPNKEGYSDWREYAKAHDPELIKKNHLPPSDCSFSMFYPKQALKEYPSRKPYFGWIINTTEQMEKQIEMAVKYGIDYFVFCFYIGSNDPVFDESGNIKTDVLESFPYNNAVYRFLEATNNYKMKFSVLVCDHANRTNEKTLFQLLKYINEKFVSHPSFMYINGRPMICFFDSHFQNKIKVFHQINGSLLIQNGMDIIPKNGINGRMSYGGAIPSNIGLHPYSDISNYNNNIVNKYYVNSPSYMDIPTVSVGRNDFPRADFITKNETNSFGFIEPTKDELLTHFKKIIDTLPKYSKQDQTLLIYAWNEFGEGGYLVPTEGITTTVVNEYPLLDSLGKPILDPSSNPLYCDDYKLQAVKEAKEYWINL